ncbi:MAG: glycine betaine ABC transporter substrate-binding protein [Candidatus Promineifilaceae bacterium]
MPRIATTFVALLLSMVLIACSSQAPNPTPTIALPTSTAAETFPPSTEISPTDTVEIAPTTAAVATKESVSVVVATDTSIEQRLIGQLMIEVLNENGIPVQDKTGLGDATEVRSAIEAGEVNIVLALTGQTLTEFQNIPSASLPTEAERSYQLAKTLDEPNGLIWLESADYNATPVVLVRESLNAIGIRTLEDLAQFANDNRIKLCIPPDYTDVKLRGLLDTYTLQIAPEDVVVSSTEAVLDGLRDGACEVGLGQITDGRIDAWDLSIVLDNLNYFPINNPAPIIRAEILEAYPEIETLMGRLFGGLSGRVIQNLSAQIAIGADGEPASDDERPIEAVAERYLEREGLLGDLPAITVGITSDQADGLLGLLLALELFEDGFDVEERTYTDSDLLRNALVQGDVDVAWDNSAHALVTYHNIPKTALPEGAEATYRLSQSLDLQYHNLSWQQPALFNAGDSMFTAIPTLTTIDEVAAVLDDGANLRLCLATGDYESLLEDWAQLYLSGFSAESIIIADPQLILPMVGNGDCDLGISETTNPQAIEFGLKRLEDTQNYLPETSVAPVVRQDTLVQHPHLAAIISSISDVLSEETYLAMRAQIALGFDGEPNSGDEEDVAVVVRNFLADTRVQRERPTIVIGVQNFTETLLLAEMTKQLFLTAGFEEVEITQLGSSVSDQYLALNTNSVEITWVYVGAALQVVHNQPDSIGDTTLAWQRITQLDQGSPYQWLQPSAFNNTFTLLVNPSQDAIDPALQTLDQLAEFINTSDTPLSVCVEEDFFKRPDGLQALQVEYGFEFDTDLIKIVAFDELYPMLAEGECDIAEGFRTDGRVNAERFRSLEDTKRFFPAYNAAPVIQSGLATAYPNLVQSLETLATSLTDEVMVELNALVDFGTDTLANSGDEEVIETVATIFLCEQELITNECSSANRSKTVVASPPENKNGCESLDLNGGFEDLRGWEIPNTRVFAKYSTDAAHSGNRSMRMGIASGEVESHTIVEQTILLPDDLISAEISFWYLPKTADIAVGDVLAMQLYDIAITEAYETHKLDLTGGAEWVEAAFDLSTYIGERFELYFVVINDGDERPTLVYLDDVDIRVCR